MKKIKYSKLMLLITMGMTSTAFASGLGTSSFVSSTPPGVNPIKDTKQSVERTQSATNKTTEIAKNNAGKDPVADLLKPKVVKGSYSSSVPGGNPFIFCSGPRPSRKSPLRPIYDKICPDGKTSPEQAMAKNGLNDHIKDAQNLSKDLAKSGTSMLTGVGLSDAASKILGAQLNNDGTSKNANNMSFNDYNNKMYNQIKQEDYLRKQEAYKAAINPEYVPKEIPNSKAYNLNSTNIIKNQQASMEQLSKEVAQQQQQLNKLNNQVVVGSNNTQKNTQNNNVTTNTVSTNKVQSSKTNNNFVSAFK